MYLTWSFQPWLKSESSVELFKYSHVQVLPLVLNNWFWVRPSHWYFRNSPIYFFIFNFYFMFEYSCLQCCISFKCTAKWFKVYIWISISILFQFLFPYILKLWLQLIVIGINQIPDRGKGEEMHKENFFCKKKKERWKDHQMKNRTETLFKKKHMKIFICKALFFFFFFFFFFFCAWIRKRKFWSTLVENKQCLIRNSPEGEAFH